MRRGWRARGDGRSRRRCLSRCEEFFLQCCFVWQCFNGVDFGVFPVELIGILLDVTCGVVFVAVSARVDVVRVRFDALAFVVCLIFFILRLLFGIPVRSVIVPVVIVPQVAMADGVVVIVVEVDAEHEVIERHGGTETIH